MNAPIEATEAEMETALDPRRDDSCPQCCQRVGTGQVRCRACAAELGLDFPHWHVSCDLAVGDCPTCKARYLSPCIC